MSRAGTRRPEDRGAETTGGGTQSEDVAREWGCPSTRSTPGRRSRRDGCERGQEVKQLRDNTKLKKLVVDLSLDKEMLKALIAKNGWSS